MPYWITQCYLPPVRGVNPAFPQPKQVLDLATPEGCKAELRESGPSMIWTSDLSIASPTFYGRANTQMCLLFQLHTAAPSDPSLPKDHDFGRNAETWRL